MDEVAHMISRIKKLSLTQQRCVAALLGATVADAATRPLHWIYNQTQLDGIVGGDNPEFWHENKSPFYSLPLGRCSGYNDTGKNFKVMGYEVKIHFLVCYLSVFLHFAYYDRHR